MTQVIPTLFSSNIRVGYPGNISSTDPSTTAPSVGDIALGIVYSRDIGVTSPFIDHFDSVTYGGQAMTHLDELDLTAGGHYLWNAWYRIIDGTEVGSTFKPYWGGHVDLEYVAILIFRHADTLASMTGLWTPYPGATLSVGATMPFATAIFSFADATPATYPTLALMGMHTASVTVGGTITTAETGASEWTSLLTGSNLSGSARAHGRLWSQDIAAGDVLTAGDLTTTHAGGFSNTLDATFYGRGLFTFESATVIPDPADTEGGGSVYTRRHVTAKALPYHLNTGMLQGVPRGKGRR